MVVAAVLVVVVVGGWMSGHAPVAGLRKVRSSTELIKLTYRRRQTVAVPVAIPLG